MALDVRRVARTRAWLVKAQRDLITVEQIMAHDQPMLDSVVFHCQQAGEKALKSFLFWHDIPFRKTHNLMELLTQCVTIDATLSILEASALFLRPLVSIFVIQAISLNHQLRKRKKHTIKRHRCLLRS